MTIRAPLITRVAPRAALSNLSVFAGTPRPLQNATPVGPTYPAFEWRNPTGRASSLAAQQPFWTNIRIEFLPPPASPHTVGVLEPVLLPKSRVAATSFVPPNLLN